MFNAKVDATAVTSGLTAAEEKQIPFAVSLALNLTAHDAQGAQREHLKGAFSLRRMDFNLKGIYISKADRATKANWSVVIKILGNRDYLDKFEEGGYHLPTRGRWIWKPNLDVFKSGIVPENLRPGALSFKRKGGAMVGNERTFMVKTKSGESIVLQRTGGGLDKKSKRNLGRMDLNNFKGGMGPSTKREKYSLRRDQGVRMLYQLVSRVKVPVKLEFVDVVGQTVTSAYPRRFKEAFQRAMDTAK